jgi:hypothetical protein
MTQQANQAPALKPVAVRRDEGDARWWFGGLAVIKATATDTGGQMTIVEMTEPPGAEAPLHVHHREDEAFWVLDGDVTFEVGDATRRTRGTTPSAHATSRTVTSSATQAAGCCSSAPPPASRISSLQ